MIRFFKTLVFASAACLTLSCQPQEKAASADMPVLPFAEAGTPDQPAVPWTDLAWSADAFYRQPSSASFIPAQIRMAWNNRGLRVQARIEDGTAFAPKQNLGPLDQGDSLEVIVAFPADSKKTVRLLCAPGMETAGGKLHFAELTGGREKPSSTPVETLIARENRGFSVEALIPWDRFEQTPQENDRIGVQISIRDFYRPGSMTRQTLAPIPTARGAGPGIKTFVLGKTAAAPQLAAASLDVYQLKGSALSIFADPSLENQAVEYRLTPESPWKSAGKLSPSNGALIQAILPLDLPTESKAGDPVEVRIGRSILPPVTIPNLAKARSQALRDCAFVGKPSVFSGNALPPVEFVNPDVVQSVFGPLDIKIRYFNSNFQEVLSAETPGRYGALVDITTPDGIKDRRRITLFRTAEPYNRRKEKYETNLKFPPSFGLPASVLNQAQTAIRDFTSSQLSWLSREGRDWAILPASLSDLAAKPAENHDFDLSAINQHWWSTLEKKLNELEPYPFLLELPEGYDSNPEKHWPLLLFLHGAGERGSDLNMVKVHGPPKLIQNGKKFPFIVVSPQCPSGDWWAPLKLNELLDNVSKTYRVDPKRIYVTGLSMGGYGSWAFAARYPERIAAIAPICGGAAPSLAPRLKNMPVWNFHGDADEAVPIQESQGIIKALESIGAKPKFTVYPGVDHNSWTVTYENPALYEWLLQQHR